tara:strand:- start:390 stop:590 length:201 start_codon:yes stop_codon:yes gene_type:complete
MIENKIPDGMIACDNCNIFVYERSCDIRDVYNDKTRKEITFFLCITCSDELEDEELLYNMETRNVD